MTECIVVQVGQCGNQIGGKFWEMVLKEHSSVSSMFDRSMSSFFRNMDDKLHPPLELKVTANERIGIKSLRARAVLVDMEEGVVNSTLRGPLGGLFDHAQFVTDVSGSGNNWATGHLEYGKQYAEQLNETVRRAAEQCDCLSSFFLLHSLGGGTGSGLGTRLLRVLEDAYPEVERVVLCVLPSEQDDVVTSPYNSILGLNQLIQHASCIMPVDNQALGDIVTRLQIKSRTKNTNAFDSMNSVVAGLLLNLTCSSRFEGSLNVDLNELCTNLVPFPRLHMLLCSQCPLVSGTSAPGARTVDELFTSVFEQANQLLDVDPKHDLFLASALIGRGKTLGVSDLRRNIDRLRKQLRFVAWNEDGWKTGLCNVPPVGEKQSVVAVSNNTAITSVLEKVQHRFDMLFRRKAHLHHYTRVDGMEMDLFRESAECVTSVITEYNHIRLQTGHSIEPRLTVL